MNCARLVFFICLCGCSFAFGQSGDTSRVLDAVIVKGYASDRPLNEVPAAIGYVDQKKLDRFNSTSLLPSVNTIPGVRMEERSPGSYRFAIRGSSLRSPFGVRNVKIYWNGLPLTDGGGNTYLNLIDVSAIGSAEVIKGPGSSLYGAGTGGVVLLNSAVITQPMVQFSATVGSYGLRRYQLAGQTGTDKFKVRFQYAHQEADGYRIQSAMRKDAANAEVRLRTGARSTLSAMAFYTDLYYQTPGGLTLTEYTANKKQARPNTPAFLGAVAQQASISNKTLFGGLTYEHEWNSHWSHRTGVYASHTRFVNPAIRNYEVRTEDNAGGRTETQYKTEGAHWKSKLTFGGEFQYFKSPLSDYGNDHGTRDTLQFADHLESTQAVLFIQEEMDLPANFFLTVGGSTTFLQYRFLRTSEPQPQQQTRDFNPVFSPRVALLKKLNPFLSVYGSLSQGFSTPSLAEVRPSSNLYNNTLSPEHGRNYELGIKGSVLDQRVTLELTGYYFSLNNTIVTPDGGDHYINSGKTSQPGVEAGLGWNPVVNASGTISDVRLWSNFTYNPYKFRDYHVGSYDFSGSKLTGVARDNTVSGIDVALRAGLYCNITFTHTGAIRLKDGNTIAARSYYLMGAKAGYRMALKAKGRLDIFTGVDNAFNQRYSLGNDLNGAGGRYFNAAAPQNFYVSVKASL